MNYNKDNAVVLKPERDKHVRNKHPWVFMGAIQSYPENFTNGSIVPVITASGEFIGQGYFNQGQSISGRMISFTDIDPLESIKVQIRQAMALRKAVIPPLTTAYRLINGEGDSLPGLIVDIYDTIAVVQINTLGMEQLKPTILEELQSGMQLQAVYEKSATATRKKEGLHPAEGWIVGEAEQPIIVEEHGLQFSIALTGMQKTGFFLDQRENRELVRKFAHGKTVLNCFSYTGGFSVYALAGGAKRADSLDSSDAAIDGARANVALNNFNINDNRFIVEDTARYLQHMDTTYDFIILDPPAFAKRASDVKNASRGYREINRLAMQKLSPGGLLLTSSCSAYIDKSLFQTIIFQAAKDAKRDVKILSYHQLAADHPINLFYPEGDYLKSLLLYLA